MVTDCGPQRLWQESVPAVLLGEGYFFSLENCEVLDKGLGHSEQYPFSQLSRPSGNTRAWPDNLTHAKNRDPLPGIGSKVQNISARRNKY
jgi:hypothetical protein